MRNSTYGAIPFMGFRNYICVFIAIYAYKFLKKAGQEPHGRRGIEKGEEGIFTFNLMYSCICGIIISMYYFCCF